MVNKILFLLCGKNLLEIKIGQTKINYEYPVFIKRTPLFDSSLEKRSSNGRKRLTKNEHILEKLFYFNFPKKTFQKNDFLAKPE